MKRRIHQVTWLVVATAVSAVLVQRVDGGVTLGTAFIYQGQLKDDGVPLNDTVDLRFRLWDAPEGGGLIPYPEYVNDVVVVNGLFTVHIDFGQDAFNGDARWLEIGVRLDPAGSYETLSPRQPISPTPAAPYPAKLLPKLNMDTSRSTRLRACWAFFIFHQSSGQAPGISSIPSRPMVGA